MIFTAPRLRDAGFVGWPPLLDIRCNPSCPSAPGVYVVTYPTEVDPRFRSYSCGGWFKGRDPTVTSQVLSANWVDRAEVVYIGKAIDLRRRLRQFADFGQGKPIGHWGGRLLWQLDRPGDLAVGWRETPHDDPLAIEGELIETFKRAHGKPPFANNPDRLGR